MRNDISKRVAFVIGGAGVLGTAICNALAGAGCTVAAGDVIGGTEDGERWLHET